MINFEGLVKRLMQVGGLAALIMIVFSFSARIAEYTRLNAQQGIESTRIAELIATQSYLGDQIAFATSQAAVEEWAREEARMAQEGDFPVVPLNPEGIASPLENQENTVNSDLSNIQVWWEWFFYR